MYLCDISNVYNYGYCKCRCSNLSGNVDETVVSLYEEKTFAPAG